FGAFYYYRWSYRKYLIFVLPAVTFLVTFLILNSPFAYYSGLTYHPNTNTSDFGVVKILEGLFSPKYFNFWGYNFFYNITLPILFFIILGIFYIIKTKQRPLIFLLIIIFIYFPITLTTYLPSVISGPWGFQSSMNLLLIVAALGFVTFFPSHKFISILLILTIIPISAMHGLRLFNDPVISYHNVKFGETNMQQIADDINSDAKNYNQYYVHFVLDHHAFPEWLMLKNINNKPWTHKEKLNVFVTDREDLVLEYSKNKEYRLFKTYKYSVAVPIYMFKKI
ncbi:MAG: hypothetical protein AABY22_18980, partial [Nanoarchaeota archaeon]